MGRPVRVAIYDDYALVVAGVDAALAPYRDRIEVVELSSQVPLTSDVDILLYDTFAQPHADAIDVEELANDHASKVVAFSWNIDPDVVTGALERGVAGYIGKSTTAEELVDSLERVHAGEVVVPAQGAEAPGEDAEEREGSDPSVGNWPGRDVGLTEREAEVLALVTQGLSNDEIARRIYLGINTVKTHIRHAYRKIGVARRSQAVVWGMEHGFRPDRERRILHRDSR